MEDKRTYKNHKEHGEDMSHENEVNHGGKRPQGQVLMPNAQMAEQQGLLRR